MSLLAYLRFWLGLNVVILVLTLLSRLLTPGAPPLTPRGVLITLLLTGLGFVVGLGFARYWPRPDVTFQRIIRMFMLAIPVVGISLALGVLLQPEITSLVFAVAAFLGAQWTGVSPARAGHRRT